MVRLLAQLFLCIALACGCMPAATQAKALTVQDLQGLWVSNDLYLKLEGHPETQDADETLPCMRIKDGHYWMLDSESSITGDVTIDSGQVRFLGKEADGMALPELSKELGANDAKELLGPANGAYDPAAETLVVSQTANYSSTEGMKAGPSSFRVTFRRLGSGSHKSSEALSAAEAALVGDWQITKISPEMHFGTSEKDRLEKALSEAAVITQGLYLSGDHTFSMAFQELNMGTWKRSGSVLILYPKKSSSKEPLSDSVSMTVGPDGKTLIERSDEKNAIWYGKS